MALKNLAISTVATAPSPATSGTSLVVASGHGARFPSVPFQATIWPAGTNPDPSNAEIVTVTAVSTDTLTITRAQESTSARTVVVGDQIAATITAAMFEPLQQSWAALSGTSPALTFGAVKQNLTLTTSGNTTFSASGYAQGYEIELYLTEGNAVLRTLAFPSWTWLEGAPASIAASKSMRITLKCTGATAASVFATYAVQL